MSGQVRVELIYRIPGPCHLCTTFDTINNRVRPRWRRCVHCQRFEKNVDCRGKLYISFEGKPLVEDIRSDAFYRFPQLRLRKSTCGTTPPSCKMKFSVTVSAWSPSRSTLAHSDIDVSTQNYRLTVTDVSYSLRQLSASRT